MSWKSIRGRNAKVFLSTVIGETLEINKAFCQNTDNTSNDIPT